MINRLTSCVATLTCAVLTCSVAAFGTAPNAQAGIAQIFSLTSIDSAVTSSVALSGESGMSSDLRIPLAAETEHGLEQVVVGSMPFYGPVVLGLDGQVLNKQLVVYQDLSLHLVPRGSDVQSLKLADGFVNQPEGPISDGGVEIPPGYVYSPTHVQPGYHDYCTLAPNYFTSPEISADFRGPCARHDICMEAEEFTEFGLTMCNIPLWLDLIAVCTNTYEAYPESRDRCSDAGRLYYAAVTLANAKRL